MENNNLNTNIPKEVVENKKSTIFNKNRKHKPHYRKMKDKNSLVRDKKSHRQINKKSP